MSTPPFGAPGFAFPAFDPAQFERFMRPFLGAAAPAPAASDPFAWWRPAAPAPAPGFDPTALASQWMGQIQQLAAQFGGADAQAADIARAWRGLIGENPFGQTAAMGAFMPSAFFTGAGAPRAPFDMPAFGYTREHQERAQSFARTMAEFQQAAQAFGALVAESGQDAFKRFESLLETRAGEGKPVESARGLFDLWIDAAEDAYADIALTERFQKASARHDRTPSRPRHRPSARCRRSRRGG
ncbi:poly(R)-hydroxyalkanoic acid synthase subunit PhaE, partial [Lysobacter xanthus]